MNRIIIAGGRDFIADNAEFYYQKFDNILINLQGSIEIVSGGAAGADNLGETYAASRRHGLTIMEAKWKKHGKAAGMIRNADMAKYAQSPPSNGYLIALWDGKSRGTGGMIKLAKQYGIAIRTIPY